jgi:hypothetical protein
MSKADDEIKLLANKLENISMSLEHRNAQCLFEITVQLIRLNERIEEHQTQLLDTARHHLSEITVQLTRLNEKIEETQTQLLDTTRQRKPKSR